ncbi:HVCN1 [Mytilus coruscus]|uniref:HVCN1 n=1 Tax=Mytilus coruscus TaxID=42192 RepID=A0A6J8AZU6_MYTCO|nr:HVCN1 [Mytilus coruscus]
MEKFKRSLFKSTPKNSSLHSSQTSPSLGQNGLETIMEKEGLSSTTHYTRKKSFPFQHEHGLHAGMYSAHGSRRPSVAYRAVKAVENVARRMSTPDFSIERIEQNLEEELERESKEPEKLGDILRRSGEKLLHSKKVLFLIVLLNIIDCGLVLDMVNDSKVLIKKFMVTLRTEFAAIFGLIDTLDVPAYFNTVINTISHPSKYNWTLSNKSSDHFQQFIHQDMPTFLDPTVTTIEEDIAHAFHKASIAILGFLVLMTILKVFCYGKEIFKKKLQLFDGVIVIISFVLDLAFIKGMMEYPLEDAVEILAFLIPWRVIRVANSLVVTVTDQAHLQLKIIYSQKKSTESRLQFSQQQNQYHSEVLNRVKKLCEEEGIPTWKLSTAINEIPFPRKKRSKKFGLSIKKTLDKSINCIRLHDPRVSLPYGDPNIVLSHDKMESDSDEEDNKSKMFQVPSIHIIEPSDTIFESEEEDEENDESSFSDDENDDSRQV